MRNDRNEKTTILKYIDIKPPFLPLTFTYCSLESFLWLLRTKFSFQRDDALKIKNRQHAITFPTRGAAFDDFFHHVFHLFLLDDNFELMVAAGNQWFVYMPVLAV